MDGEVLRVSGTRFWRIHRRRSCTPHGTVPASAIGSIILLLFFSNLTCAAIDAILEGTHTQPVSFFFFAKISFNSYSIPKKRNGTWQLLPTADGDPGVPLATPFFFLYKEEKEIKEIVKLKIVVDPSALV